MYETLGFKCPEFDRGELCEICIDPDAYYDRQWAALVDRYGIGASAGVRGSCASLGEAVAHLEHYLGRSFTLDADNVLEAAAWWYIPYGWVGCGGFIIDKANGHVNQLGSALSKDDWFWGQEHGFKHDTYDLIVTRFANLDIATTAILRLGLRYPQVDAAPVQWYSADQVRCNLASLPAVFANQRLGLTIPSFREAEANKAFEYDLIVRQCVNPGCAT